MNETIIPSAWLLCGIKVNGKKIWGFREILLVWRLVEVVSQESCLPQNQENNKAAPEV